MKLYFQLLGKTAIWWLATIMVVLIINETLIENQSADDITGFVLSSLLYLLLLSAVFYFPVLTFLTKRFKEKYFKLHPIICGLLLNFPFMVYSLTLIGRAFQASEAFLFNLMFIIVGADFGFRFARLYKNRISTRTVG